MYKNNVFTFSYDDWKYGIQPSPYIGVQDMRNLDPFSKLGALLCGKKPTAFNNVNLAGISHAAFDERAETVYIGSADGRLLTFSLSSPAYNLISGLYQQCKGIAVWKNHVIYAGETKVEVYDIAAPFVYDAWEDFEEGTRNLIDLPHHVLVGRDDVVYITDGRYIASLQQANPAVAFDPNTPSTYTWNPTALDLPEGYVAATLSEYGTYLIIGTYFTEVLNRGNRADIFPWNKISQSFNNPICSKGNGVWQSVEYNNRLFALYDRTQQKLVQTNLSAYEVLRELRLTTGDKMMHPDGIDVLDEEVLMGIGTRSSAVAGCGIYGYKQTDAETALLHLKSTLSQGETGVEIGSVLNVGEGRVFVTWKKGTTYGVDLFDDNVIDAYDTSYVVSPYTVIAREGSKKTFKTIEVSLGKKLITGQGIRVSYRANRDDAWTILKTIDFDTFGAVSSITSTIDGMSPVTGIEVKVELKGAGTDSPEFISLNLI